MAFPDDMHVFAVLFSVPVHNQRFPRFIHNLPSYGAVHFGLWVLLVSYDEFVGVKVETFVLEGDYVFLVLGSVSCYFVHFCIQLMARKNTRYFSIFLVNSKILNMIFINLHQDTLCILNPFF